MARNKIERGLEMALAARCAYPDGEDGLKELKLDNIQRFGTVPVEGFVGSTGKKVILAFRGSTYSQGDYDILTWMEKIFTDWKANFQLNPQQFHSGLVQGSYLASLRLNWEQILHLLNDHGTKDKNLWICGHSLGGGLAALAGAMCKWDSQLDVAGVYTFGAPKVGDEAFAENYPVPLYRFENRNDIFPHLPPNPQVAPLLRVLEAHIEEAFERWFGERFWECKFAPIGELNYIDKKGHIVPEISASDRLVGLIKATILDRTQLLQDHWIDSYCAAIDANL